MASGGKKGLAQSIFQVGGNAGSAIGPLLAALIIIPRGQSHISWFALVAILAIIILLGVGRWYQSNMQLKHNLGGHAASSAAAGSPDRKSKRLNSSHYCAPRMPPSA